ncbi:hypothetical protein [Tessaracoccus sp. OH4464_COT-324]|uniref:hypothetical protein n=1 Tax=Tessaracoccus sp. OH4464_COT-324 TaxID=2491059 RepID=UPI000F63E45C|nr:hypothetical protein [Tessaracoccus sp. OH4464_COT-324]RRD46984.1 hypothetical protein EII42_04650 [Tessaracoccus sp. OH4464_COT-324]
MRHRPEAPRPSPRGGVPPHTGSHQQPTQPAAPQRWPAGTHAQHEAPQADRTAFQRTVNSAARPAFTHAQFEATDQDRFVAPPVEQEHARAPLPWKAAAYTLVLVLTIAVGLGYVYVKYLNTQVYDPNTLVITNTGPEPAKRRSPQETVRGYLEALAAGDIEKALTFGEIKGDGSRALLNPDAHRRMRQKAPITEIMVHTTDEKALNVEVSYRLAGNKVEATMPLVKVENGFYALANVTTSVLLELNNAQRLPLRLAGVEVEEFEAIEVVPGIYELSTGLDFIEFPSSNTITISSLQFAQKTPFPAIPQLTSKGSEAFRTAVARSLEACVARTELAPEGCPQARRAARPIVEGSVRWQLVGNPFARVEPGLSTQDQTRATLNADLQMTLTFEYTDGSSPGTEEVHVSTTVSADMMGSDGDKLEVRWER